MATIFKIRRDTAANWSSENPTLAAGEMGLDQTNNFIKMGDGSTAWNSLAQFTQNIENVEDLVGAMVTSNTETFITVTYDDSDGTLDFVVPVLDEDAMGSNSAAHLATQQSIKSYVDAQTHLSLIDEDNMATDSATRPPSQQSVKAYVDAQTHLSLIDEDDMSTDSATRPPSQQSVKAYVDAQVTAQDLDFQGDSGGALSIDLDSETLTIAGGTGIDTVGSGNGVTASIDATVATLAGSQTLTNKTIGAATIAGHLIPDTNIAYDLGSSTHRFNDLWLDGASIRLGDATITSSGSAVVLPSGSTVSGAGTMMDFTTHVKDEDNMASDSATHVATQQSVKAYVDTVAAAQDNTDEITEGSTNLFHTAARARAAISVTDAGGDGSAAYNSSTGVITYTGPSAAEARAHISVTDAGGDGSASYNSSTGVITYTGPSAAEVRAHLSAGTGVTYSGGAISIGQAVATDSDVTFDDVVVAGTLTVNGTTTTVATTNMVVSDKLIELANGATGSPSGDLGIVMERGSSDNVFIGFDESDDKFVVGSGSFTGASTGNLTVTTGTLKANLEGATVTTTGNITVGGTVDGRDVATDGSKLDGIETAATADQTGAQIKALYEAESSAFTDAQFTKLANIEALADVTDATNVNAAGALMLSDTTTSGLGIVVDEDDMSSNSDTKVPTQQSVKAYVDATVTGEDVDITTDSGTIAIDLDSETLSILGTANEIETSAANNVVTIGLPSNTHVTGNITVGGTVDGRDVNTDGIKLDTIETSADVTDATNVAAAGAVMESGDTASAKIPSGTTAQRDGSPSAGYFRWNTTTGGAEIYDGSAWGLVGGGNTTGKMMWEHSYTVTEDYEITSGNNALTAGPITINSGYSVTTPGGCNWVII